MGRDQLALHGKPRMLHYSAVCGIEQGKTLTVLWVVVS